MAFSDVFKAFTPIQVDADIALRQHDPEKDARPFWEIYHDESNFTYFGGDQKPHVWDEAREIRVQASRIRGFKGKREYSWVITYHGEVIGQIQLFHFMNHNTCAEVGYFIKKTYWNRGINTKVLKAVCRFGIETMGLERIEPMPMWIISAPTEHCKKQVLRRKERCENGLKSKGPCLIAMCIHL